MKRDRYCDANDDGYGDRDRDDGDAIDDMDDIENFSIGHLANMNNNNDDDLTFSFIGSTPISNVNRPIVLTSSSSVLSTSFNIKGEPEKSLTTKSYSSSSLNISHTPISSEQESRSPKFAKNKFMKKERKSSESSLSSIFYKSKIQDTSQMAINNISSSSLSSTPSLSSSTASINKIDERIDNNNNINKNDDDDDNNSSNNEDEDDEVDEVDAQPWTLEEDELLLQKQEEIGNRWAIITSFLPQRNQNQLKVRFKSILRAARREWTQEENDFLLQVFNESKGDWSIIAPYFSLRTKNAVRKHYRLLMKLRKESNAPKPPPLGAPNQIFFEKFQIHSKIRALAGNMLPKSLVRAQPTASPLQVFQSTGQLFATQNDTNKNRKTKQLISPEIPMMKVNAKQDNDQIQQKQVMQHQITQFQKSQYQSQQQQQQQQQSQHLSQQQKQQYQQHFAQYQQQQQQQQQHIYHPHPQHVYQQYLYHSQEQQQQQQQQQQQIHNQQQPQQMWVPGFQPSQHYTHATSISSIQPAGTPHFISGYVPDMLPSNDHLQQKLPSESSYSGYRALHSPLRAKRSSTHSVLPLHTYIQSTDDKKIIASSVAPPPPGIRQQQYQQAINSQYPQNQHIQSQNLAVAAITTQNQNIQPTQQQIEDADLLSALFSDNEILLDDREIKKLMGNQE